MYNRLQERSMRKNRPEVAMGESKEGAMKSLESQMVVVRSPVPLKVIAFAGASNWPLWAGQQMGFFADQGIDLALELTASSVQMGRAKSLSTVPQSFSRLWGSTTVY